MGDNETDKQPKSVYNKFGKVEKTNEKIEDHVNCNKLGDKENTDMFQRGHCPERTLSRGRPPERTFPRDGQFPGRTIFQKLSYRYASISVNYKSYSRKIYLRYKKVKVTISCYI